MLAPTEIIALLKSDDTDVANQTWEICAALTLEKRAEIAAVLVEQYRWGWAARALLPDQKTLRARLLMHFAIDCTSQALPLLTPRPQLYTFCEDALNDSRGLLVPGKDTAAAQAHLLSRCKRELRFSFRPGQPPAHMRSVVDATRIIIQGRDAAQVARHASALARRAIREGSETGAEQWQRARFFALFLPVA